MIKRIIGAIIMILSFIGGFYFTFVWAFAGGLIQFVNGVVSESANDITVGLIKVILCEIPGTIAWFTGMFGLILYIDGDDF